MSKNEKINKKEKKKSGSGKTFQDQIEALLKAQNYDVSSEVPVGMRLGKDSEHRVDLLAGNESDSILISCKYQKEPGTAIDKIPYEIISLSKSIEEGNHTAGYIVVKGKELEGHTMLFGDGLTELKQWLRFSPKLRIVTDTEFSAIVLGNEIGIEKTRQLSLYE